MTTDLHRIFGHCVAAIAALCVNACSSSRVSPAASPQEPRLPADLTCDEILPAQRGGPSPHSRTRTRNACSAKGVEDDGQIRRNGPMSEKATKAMDLFESNQCDAAIPLLRQVVDGETGDERSQRQVARFRLGACLLRGSARNEGMDMLRSIAADTSDDTRLILLAWVVDHIAKDPGLLPLLREIDDLDTECLKSGARADSFPLVTYLVGRERYQRGEYGEAMYFFAKVPAGSALAGHARNCMSRVGDAERAAAKR